MNTEKTAKSLNPHYGIPMVRVVDENGRECFRGYYAYHTSRQLAPIGDSLRQEDVHHLVIHDGFADWNMPQELKVTEVGPPHRIEPIFEPWPEWKRWVDGLDHGGNCKTTMDVIEQMAYELIEHGGAMGPNGNVWEGVDEGMEMTRSLFEGYERQLIESVSDYVDEVCLRPEETEACDKWTERTDSLEQVARDMYRRMTCMAHYECHNSDCECCIDTDCQVKEVFGCRLRELGVEV